MQTKAKHRVTSSTSPIMVDWTYVSSGRLGLTLCPGKKDDYWDRDLDLDLRALVAAHDVDAVLCLLMGREAVTLGVPLQHYRSAALTRGLEWRSLPIVDDETPRDAARLEASLRWVEKWLARGLSVVVHCRGGLGRAGTIVALLLVRRGWTAAQAMRSVRASRKGAIVTKGQERFIRTYAKTWRQRRAGKKSA